MSDSNTALAPLDDLTPAQLARAAQKELAERLPARYREDVLFLERPSPESLMNLVDALPEEIQAPMRDMMRKTRPRKKGMNTTNEGFSPTELRLYQGTGNDPIRPAKLPPGEFYSTDSKARGSSITGVVLGIYQGRTLWPPREQGGGGGGKAPLCHSLDRLEGSRYGSCLSCPNADKPYNDGGCTRDVVVWFMDEDASGIFELRFSKTSLGAGEALLKILQKGDNIWDRWITFETQERTEKDRRWYVIKATPVSDLKNPENNNTNLELHDVYDALASVLLADVYYPKLAVVYDRSKTSTDSPVNGGGGAAIGGFDEAALLEPGSDDADYSQDV